MKIIQNKIPSYQKILSTGKFFYKAIFHKNKALQLSLLSMPGLADCWTIKEYMNKVETQLDSFGQRPVKKQNHSI